MKKFLVLIFALFFFQIHSQTLQTVNGVHSTAYELENGSIYIYLPEKIVAGKMFSGTVAIFPKGSSSREQAKNLEQLKKYKVKVLGKEFSAGSKKLTLTGAGNVADLSLLNHRGKSLGNTPINFEVKPALATQTPLSLPELIANSVNTSFYGVFDGNSENTSLKINGKTVNVVAESPVQISLRPESLTTTSSKIEISDGPNNYNGQCNSIYYTLKIGPTNLKRGQSTFFDATIHGVGTIDKPLTYTVVNTTTSIVNLGGGNSQSFTINPGDGEGGNWFRHFDINSISTGNFSLTTNLVVPDTPYPNMELTNEGVVSSEIIRPAPNNLDCRIYNQSFDVTAEECAALGGTVYNEAYELTPTENEDYSETTTVDVTLTQDSNEVEIALNITSGDLPEMVVSVNKPLDDETQTAVQFLTTQAESYSFIHKNQSFGKPSAAQIETTLLFSNGSSQTINTHINFAGNPFYSIAESPELTEIRGNLRRLKRELGLAKGNKTGLTRERDKERERLRNAEERYRINNSQFRYLWRIDQSLEKVRPVFADSLKVLIDSLKAFRKRTGGPLSANAAQKVDDNLRDAKKAHEDCLAQLRALMQEQTDLTNEKETLRNRQKAIHREIMDLFRTTNMDFAGSTRRDKNGVFHYQYGVVTVSGDGTATYHKGSLPVEIFSKVSALEKEMKLVTERLNAVSDRLNNLPGEINAKTAECDKLAQKAKDAETAKTKKDVISAEDQYWNNKIDAVCVKIQALLTRLKDWAIARKDNSLLALINNVKCGENIWEQIDRVINRKKNHEKGFEGEAANARRDINNSNARLTELNEKIRAEEEKIRNAQKALLASQKAEAKAAAAALAVDQQKCIDIMNELGFGATSITDVIDLYEVSQDVKKAADEAKDAMDQLKRAIDYGAKHGMDPGEAKKWVQKTQKRLGDISKRLAKLEKYKDLAGKVQEYANRIGTLIGSDGSATQNAAAFGEGLKFMKEALDALTEKFPILQVFTAYFSFITEAYAAIINGANDAVRQQYKQLLSDVRKRMTCDQLMKECRKNGDDLAKIKQWAYDEYVGKPGYDALRRDQTQSKKIIDEIVEQRMAECCFQRLQAIRAAQQ